MPGDCLGCQPVNVLSRIVWCPTSPRPLMSLQPVHLCTCCLVTHACTTALVCVIHWLRVLWQCAFDMVLVCQPESSPLSGHMSGVHWWYDIVHSLLSKGAINDAVQQPEALLSLHKFLPSGPGSGWVCCPFLLSDPSYRLPLPTNIHAACAIRAKERVGVPLEYGTVICPDEEKMQIQ